jgi:drug/metabolite transporter (DMT)-like permease
LQTNHKNAALAPYLALTATSIIWGTTWVVMKLGIQGMPALQLASIRQFLGGVLFVGFFAFKRTALPTRQQWKQLLVLSFLTFVFANGLSTWSLEYIPGGFGALIGALYPLMVVVIEYFLYKSKQLNALSLVGILLGIAGLVLVLYQNLVAPHTMAFYGGLALAIAAMISWSFSTVFLSKNKSTLNPYYGMGWQMLISSVFIYLLSLGYGKNIALETIPVKSWLSIAYLIAFGSIAALVAFLYSLQKLPSGIATLYAYINPIIAIVLGSFVLPDEHLTWQIIVGTCVTLLGVYLVNYSIRSQMQKG